MSHDTEVAALRAEVAELRACIELLQGHDRAGPEAPQGNGVGRRQIIRAAAGAALGGVAAVAAQPAGRAAAANGDDLVLGNVSALGSPQTTTSPTQVNYSGTADVGFVFQSGSTFSASLSNANAALAGWTDRTANPVGVYGYSNVQSTTAAGVEGQAGKASAVAMRAKHTVSGGIAMVAESTADGTAMRALGGRTGVQAKGDVGVNADGGNIAVVASGPIGVDALGARYGVTTFGSSAAMLLRPKSGGPPFNRTDQHSGGEVDTVFSGSGTTAEFWACVDGGTPGTWRRVVGPDTAGAFTAIEPARGYDSRAGLPQRGAIAGGQDRVVSIARGRDLDTGEVTIANLVPVGATAIAYNITVTNTTDGGFLAVAPGDATGFGAAAVNWGGPGTTVGNAGIVKLDDNRQIKVFAGGGTTDFVVDVTGYFL